MSLVFQGRGENLLVTIYIKCVCVYTSTYNIFWYFTFFSLLKKILFSFREMGMEGERDGEKHQCVRDTSISCLSQTLNQRPGNPGMCPNWELNQWPFCSQASAQSTEPHQPGPHSLVLLVLLSSQGCKNHFYTCVFLGSRPITVAIVHMCCF